MIPDLRRLGLSAEQIEFRRQCVGGSDANVLMSGDGDKIENLWRVKRGEAEPEDLSDVLPVIMGSYTEPLNLAWHEKVTGRIVDEASCGMEVMDFDRPWRTATLDAITSSRSPTHSRIVDAKHVSAFAKDDEVLAKYLPQLTHNMDVCGIPRATLSVFVGTLRYVFFDVELDRGYADALREIEEDFWSCVESGRAPIARAVPAAPVPVSEMRKVDLTGDNEFADAAGRWLTNRTAAKIFEESAKILKEKVEADVAEATGYGVKVTRAKTGALTVREAKK